MDERRGLSPETLDGSTEPEEVTYIGDQKYIGGVKEQVVVIIRKLDDQISKLSNLEQLGNTLSQTEGLSEDDRTAINNVFDLLASFHLANDLGAKEVLLVGSNSNEVSLKYRRVSEICDGLDNPSEEIKNLALLLKMFLDFEQSA